MAAALRGFAGDPAFLLRRASAFCNNCYTALLSVLVIACLPLVVRSMPRRCSPCHAVRAPHLDKLVGPAAVHSLPGSRRTWAQTSSLSESVTVGLPWGLGLRRSRRLESLNHGFRVGPAPAWPGHPPPTSLQLVPSLADQGPHQLHRLIGSQVVYSTWAYGPPSCAMAPIAFTGGARPSHSPRDGGPLEGGVKAVDTEPDFGSVNT